MRILYDSKKTEYKKPFGALRRGEECMICIKIPAHCQTKEVFVCMENDNIGTKQEIPMQMKSVADDYEIYCARFSLEKTGLYFYHFFIKTQNSDFALYRFDYDQTNIEEGESWQLTCYPEDFTVPPSFCGKVMYQIFPDRFYHDDLENAIGKLEPYYIHDNVDDIPEFRPNEHGEVMNCDFYGGNLKGITKKLDYIKSLGTSIIYLNPIFMAFSNHRYDTCDYKKIDPLLGSEEDFINLCNEAHKRGIKIILDGVFSHTGSNSVYFDKKGIFGNGAYSNPESPYKDWYSFGKSKDDYESWWGIATLPCVRELSPDYMDYIINDKDSVVAHWLNLGADGYRLDVADELPDEFIKALRTKVKAVKSESFVVGEVWEDASNKISYSVRRKYFSDAELDSVMNYVFKNAIISYCTDKITALDFAREIMTIVENYPKDAVDSLMNSLSTHDTLRIITCLSDEDESMPKEDKANFCLSTHSRLIAKNRLYIAALLQYTLPGTACIYYGDEIGMEGFGDPFNRGYYKWNDGDSIMREYFAELGKIKNTCSALQTGDISFVRCGNVLEFVRTNGKSSIRVIVNKGDESVEAPSGNILISHKISHIGDKIYICKNGFAIVA